MDFAMEIYSKQKKFTGLTLLNEIIILQNKWRARGLDDEMLIKIKCFYVPSYVSLTKLWARFDVGKFDVNTFR